MDVRKVWRELCDNGRVGFSSSACVRVCVPECYRFELLAT
jgi:hypothetical protein